MALPTLSKTWQFAVNQQITSGQAGYGELMFAWKTALTTFGSNPWTVVSSSNHSTAGAADYWTSAAACNWHGSPGEAHSWIVLKQAGVATNFQICVDLNKNGGGGWQVMNTYISENAGFGSGSAGTILNRPTATDEINAWGNPSAGTPQWTASLDLSVTPGWLHVQQSSDGEITRWWIFIGGICYTFVNIEKPRDAMPGWVLPWVCSVVTDAYSYIDYRPTYGYLNDVNTLTTSRAGAAETWLYYTSEFCVDSMLGQRQTTSADLDGGSWPFFPIGLFSNYSGRVGRLGALTDIWWGSTAVADGDYYPADLTRQFVQIGDLIVPWNGSSMMRA